MSRINTVPLKFGRAALAETIEQYGLNKARLCQISTILHESSGQGKPFRQAQFSRSMSAALKSQDELDGGPINDLMMECFELAELSLMLMSHRINKPEIWEYYQTVRQHKQKTFVLKHMPECLTSSAVSPQPMYSPDKIFSS